MLPHIEDQYLGVQAPPSAYFLNLFHKTNREKEIGAVGPTDRDTVVLLEIFSMIHKDYTSAIDTLTGRIEALKEEVSELQATASRPNTPTPIPYPPPTEEKSSKPANEPST